MPQRMVLGRWPIVAHPGGKAALSSVSDASTHRRPPSPEARRIFVELRWPRLWGHLCTTIMMLELSLAFK